MPGKPQPVARPAPATKAGAAVAAVAAAALAIAPFTAIHEGEKLVPYRDLGGKWTVCNGETQVAMRRYTHAECQAMLAKALRDRYGPPIVACIPTLVENPAALQAMIDTAYNAGAPGLCRSPAAALFRVRRWAEGCKALLGWRATVHGVPVRGLANRRRDEAALCARGLS